ncbi:MAG: PH domain-containing protein [Candidatus Shapirobacteria bacterium]|nr:PH domain-containing protein [Candidatus Shapirobacteria bacterium]
MALIYKAPEKDETSKDSKSGHPQETSSLKKTPPGSSLKKKKKKNKKEIYHDIAQEIRAGVGLSVEPRGVNFADKAQDEEVLVVLRRHPITNAPWVALGLVMFFIMFFAFHFGWLNFLSSSLEAAAVYAWLLLTLLVAWSGLLSWYFNVSIISDKRVIDIDFHDLIYREVSDANLDKIEDVTHNMGGLLGIVFNFGDVYIQTAGAKPQIEFLRVPHPAEVASTLRKLREAATD